MVHFLRPSYDSFSPLNPILDLWSSGWVSSYMAHDFMDFSPIPLDVFQTLSFAKALVNGFARLSLDLI